MFPIDPTPYVFVYIFVVFFCPWLVYGYWVIRNMRYFYKMRPSQFWLFGFSGWKEYRQFRKQDPHAMYLWRMNVRWFIVTAILWVVGFAVFALTLFLMDKHGLLIGGIK